MAALEAVPGITGYIVGEGESLWDIAKQYYLTPQQIMTMNELESETIQKGDCLILMKTIPASATVR
jgi:LysM repeat protein